MAKKRQAAVEIIGLIHEIRGHKVILDRDIAKLYGVETKVLVQAVKRNARRFPSDFMIRLDIKEFSNLKSQFVTSSLWGGTRKLPVAFTEHGVAMLSSVLNSTRAIDVNIAIIRAFISLRTIAGRQQEIAKRIDDLETRVSGTEVDVKGIFDAIRELVTIEAKPAKKIGFGAGNS